MQSEFRVNVRNGDGATVIEISGELDLASAPALEDAVERALAAPEPCVIIDLRELQFMDSTGLSVLVKAHQAAGEASRRLVLVKGPPQVARLLSLTGVADRLALVDSPEEALREG